MYKVFTDNDPKIYTVETEKDLLEVFHDHKFIEAAGGIVAQKEEFLFIKRNGVWDIPKGKLEKGESSEEGAVREIEEECNVKKLKLEQHLVDTWHTYKMNGKLMIKKTYWYYLHLQDENQDLLPQTEEGITEVKFFPAKDFEIVRENTYGSIHEVLDALEVLLLSKD